MIAQVRNTYPDLVMRDCNSGFTLDDIDMFRELDRLDMKMIEQPLAYDDLVDHAELQKGADTDLPGESITSVRRAAKAIKPVPAVDQYQNKPGWRTANALAVHDLCRDHGVPVWVGGMLESAVGQGPSIALATKDNIGYPCDIFPSSRFSQRIFPLLRSRFQPKAGSQHPQDRVQASRRKWTICKNSIATASISSAG